MNLAEAYAAPPAPMPPALFDANNADYDPFDLPEEFEAAPEPEPETSDPTPGIVQLRGYQEQAVTAVWREFQSKIKSTLVVAATGTGKSICLAELSRRANSLGHGVLILVHRDELIRQLRRSCARVGINAHVEKAQERALRPFQYFSQTDGAQTVIASVQTLRGNRLAEWPKDAFKLIIIDEAHHAPAESYRAVMRHFSAAKRAGFTATADRLDGENIGQVFETLAFEYNLRTAISDKWLVPIEAMPLTTDPKIDLRDLRIVGGDFNAGDLERTVNENIGVLVNAVADTNALEKRRTIAFTPDISSANALALALSDVGISSRAVAGNSPDRAAIFKGHQSGQFQVLVNCMIATEGYDDPEVSAILICRPTKSRALYSQMVGRGTRLHPESGKENCRVVDFAFLTGKHQLVSPVDLYDNSETPDEVVDRARELVNSGQERDIDAALETSMLEFENAQRVKIQRRAVSVRASKFDPVSACEIFGIPQKAGNDWQNIERASPKQVEALRKWGIDAPDDMGKGVASKLLNKIFARKEHGWTLPRTVANLLESGLEVKTATGMRENEAREYLAAHPLGPSEKQAKMLRWKGVPDAEIAGMTRKDASAKIDAIMKAGRE